MTQQFHSWVCIYPTEMSHMSIKNQDFRALATTVQNLNQTIFILYCCVISYHNFNSLKQQMFIISEILYLTSRAQLNWVLCLHYEKAAIGMLARLSFHQRLKVLIDIQLVVDIIQFLEIVKELEDFFFFSVLDTTHNPWRLPEVLHHLVYPIW